MGVSVQRGIRLDCESDLLVVYREEESPEGPSAESATRMVLRGPLLYMPKVGERTHEFRRSGFVKNVMTPEKVRFRVLHANKHRSWNVNLQITARGDSTPTFSAHLVFGYHLESLKECL